MTRESLHAQLIEAHAWHEEEAKIFTTRFLSAWSRPTVESYLRQLPPSKLTKLSGEAWPDVGELAESSL